MGGQYVIRALVAQRPKSTVSLGENITNMKDVFIKIFIGAIFFTATAVTCVAIISITYQVLVSCNLIFQKVGSKQNLVKIEVSFLKGLCPASISMIFVSVTDCSRNWSCQTNIEPLTRETPQHFQPSTVFQLPKNTRYQNTKLNCLLFPSIPS